MDQKLQQQLFDKYPSLFVQKDLPMTQTCMNWGMEFGSGWYDLMDRTCAKIMEIDINKEVQFTQTKEKFGGLRIYFDVIPSHFHNTDEFYDKVYDIISNAEDESYTICEDCGAIGTVINNHGWLRTQCEKCKLE